MSTELLSDSSADPHHDATAKLSDIVQAHARRCELFQDNPVWITRMSGEQLRGQIQQIADRAREGAAQPLMGLTVAVKDNIDVGGIPTTSSCPGYAYTPQESATVVQRLSDSGAIIVGKTNMDQFATGLVGTRSPYGICRNVYDPNYISGGSSSGSAVAVAAGLVDVALGSDTAGSGRVPAAFNNIVGFKPTRGLISTHGLVPACRSLDCVSIFSRTCATASRVFESAMGFDETDIFSRRAGDLPQLREIDLDEGFRFGIPRESQLEFFGNDAMRQLYRRAIERAISLGGQPVSIDLEPFTTAARLLYDGPWLAERLAAVGKFAVEHPDAVLPVISQIISAAQKFSAVDAYNGLYTLQTLKRGTEVQWAKIDVLLLPTTGTIYTIDEVLKDPVTLNKNLGYYTNFVNLLDLCAIALPAGFLPGGVPAGVTFIAPAGYDEMLLRLGSVFESRVGTGGRA